MVVGCWQLQWRVAAGVRRPGRPAGGLRAAGAAPPGAPPPSGLLSARAGRDGHSWSQLVTAAMLTSERTQFATPSYSKYFPHP